MFEDGLIRVVMAFSPEVLEDAKQYIGIDFLEQIGLHLQSFTRTIETQDAIYDVVCNKKGSDYSIPNSHAYSLTITKTAIRDAE